MKTTLGLAMLAALTLVSCARLAPDEVRADPNDPKLKVDNGTIIVDQEPILIAKENPNKKITWKLHPHSPYRFPANGITVAPEKDSGHVAFRCQKEDDRKYKCENDGRAGWYKYTIRLVGPQDLTLDPWIRNL